MQQVVSITSQGQLTLPVSIRQAFGIAGPTKAIIEKSDGKIVVRPRQNFWDLEGSFKSRVRLTDKELEEAQDKFASGWAQNE